MGWVDWVDWTEPRVFHKNVQLEGLEWKEWKEWKNFSVKIEVEAALWKEDPSV